MIETVLAGEDLEWQAKVTIGQANLATSCLQGKPLLMETSEGYGLIGDFLLKGHQNLIYLRDLSRSQAVIMLGRS